MRVLLDENITVESKNCLPGYQVTHLEDPGLKGTRNGELLALARSSFDVLITLDRGILHQHRHFGDLIILVIRVVNSKPATVIASAPDVQRALASATPGTRTEVVSQSRQI
jgi:hypothetical protein